MMFEVWEELKKGKTHYLSGGQKLKLDEWVSTRGEAERKYYARCFKFLIDPDDRERSTYECYCTKTFEEFTGAKKVPVAVLNKVGDELVEFLDSLPSDPKDLEEEVPDPAIIAKLQTVLAMIESMEDAMNISILARGGSYGGARLIVLDNKTGEELARN